MRITFRMDHDRGYVEHRLECPNLDEATEAFEDFLRGAGFVFDGSLEIVPEEPSSGPVDEGWAWSDPLGEPS